MIALGWHAAPAVPATTGPWNLGGRGFGPATLRLGWWLETAAVFARLNSGVAAALTLFLPWHIGSVALAAGDLWPGTGLGGLPPTILILGGLSAAATIRTQVLVAGIAGSFAAIAWSTYTPAPANGFLERSVTPPPALTSARRDLALMKMLQPIEGDVVVMGENVIDQREPGALERWCAYAERHDVLLYAGVLERNKRSAVHEFRPDRCVPEAVYERRFGLPGIRGGWGVGAGETWRTSWDNRPIHWLICFEAFSPAAWIMSALSPGAMVVVVANDRRTYPIPVEIMRRKVARSMARLWNGTAVFAAAGRSVGVYETRSRPYSNQGYVESTEQIAIQRGWSIAADMDCTIHYSRHPF